MPPERVPLLERFTSTTCGVWGSGVRVQGNTEVGIADAMAPERVPFLYHFTSTTRFEG